MVIVLYLGTDSTQDFEDVGHSTDARELQKRFLIGRIGIVKDTPPVSK